MINGSLLDAGASMDHLAKELSKLGLPGQAFELNLEDVIRCSYACKKFNVLMGPDKNYESGLFPEGTSLDSVKQGNAFESVKFHTSSECEIEPTAGTIQTREACPGTLTGALSLLKNSGLATGVKNLASRIFETLYKAEADCRGRSLDELVMNQLAFMDSIVDIVSFAVNYEYLGIEKAFVSPLPLGRGTFEYAGELNMGTAPATLLLVKEAQARISDTPLHNECLTATGAAILCTVAAGWSRPSFEKITNTGYGAGTYNPPSHPNACRVIIGESAQIGSKSLISGGATSEVERETILILEANIDDLSPQTLAYTSERLLAAGALDVIVLPAMMKKGRSGHLLKVLCALEDRASMQQIMFNETSTIGVRSYTAERVVADRKWQEVTMDDGSKIRVKLAYSDSGELTHAQPEYEDCAAYATKHKLPLKKVTADALGRLGLDA